MARFNARKLVEESLSFCCGKQSVESGKTSGLSRFGRGKQFIVSRVALMGNLEPGGLVTMCVPDVLEPCGVTSTRYWIWLHGKANQEYINLVNIYGPHDYQEKRLVWNSLMYLIQEHIEEPICLMGDFNCVYSIQDDEL